MKSRILRSLAVYTPQPRETLVFLAGGTTSPDWRETLINCADDPSYVWVNPVSENYDQPHHIAWELNYLRDVAHPVVFWFPETSVCAMTLFELGICLSIPGKSLYIGIHPNYPRHPELIHRIGACWPALALHDTLEGLTEAFMMARGTLQGRNDR